MDERKHFRAGLVALLGAALLAVLVALGVAHVDRTQKRVIRTRDAYAPLVASLFALVEKASGTDRPSPPGTDWFAPLRTDARVVQASLWARGGRDVRDAEGTRNLFRYHPSGPLKTGAHSTLFRWKENGEWAEFCRFGVDGLDREGIAIRRIFTRADGVSFTLDMIVDVEGE